MRNTFSKGGSSARRQRKDEGPSPRYHGSFEFPTTRDALRSRASRATLRRVHLTARSRENAQGHVNCVGRGSQPATPPWCEQHPRLGPLQEHEGEGVPSRHKYMRFSSNSACSSRKAAGSLDFTRFSASTTSGSFRNESGICTSKLRALHTAARTPPAELSSNTIAAFARSRASCASSTTSFSAGGGGVSTAAVGEGVGVITGGGVSGTTRGAVGSNAVAGVGDGAGSDGFAGAGGSAVFAAGACSAFHSEGAQ